MTSPQQSLPPSPPPPQSTGLSPKSQTRPQISLEQPSQKKNRSHSNKIIKRVRTAFRSFPIVAPAACPIPGMFHNGRVHGGTRITGTLFGHRKARVSLAIQENPKCLPMLVLELAIPTGKLLQDMGVALVRIALECEKNQSDKSKLIDEPVWTMYCNGRKTGYGVKREPTEDDLHVMQTLHVVSMGAGVLPSEDGNEPPEGELTYMRSFFERVIGSKDSETYYMMNPEGSGGPELSIFFVIQVDGK
ncbi:hypothetical protein Cgig2_010768 [Carnegiea gigantea]|uniref:Protein MIZU-KUSSEI 1 n=1 Tax=Carnegiea gigantea TaxID=171969 RepID=A0A9Q1JPR6_9CARY|nr:hypothetical protein Cgig2_010768 [Carnegiea gigantea]